jgi:hypothetical protein
MRFLNGLGISRRPGVPADLVDGIRFSLAIAIIPTMRAMTISIHDYGRTPSLHNNHHPSKRESDYWMFPHFLTRVVLPGRYRDRRVSSIPIESSHR